jgi:hypothetical protein
MADFGMTMKVKTAEYRPCMANGKKALFHRWVDTEKAYLRRGGMMETVSIFYGLVEYEDGTMDKLNPENIIFKDSKVKFEEAGS